MEQKREQISSLIQRSYVLHRTRLHIFSKVNGVSVVEQLLSEGANINEKDFFQQTSLHYLARSNKNDSHYQTAELLLNKGADINATDIYGRTPLYYLIYHGGGYRIVKLFLSFGADVNVINSKGQNLLFLAVSRNKRVEVLQLLVDSGLDVNQRDSRGRTLLQQACISQNENTLKILKCIIKNGGNPNAADVTGSKSLIEALSNFDSDFEPSSDLILKHINLNFILKHIDFNNFRVDRYNFNFLFNNKHDSCRDMVLAHLAKLETLEIFVSPALLSAIEQKEDYRNFYKRCKDELLLAKSTKFENSWITFYNLLMDNRKKLKNYAGNLDIIRDFDEICFWKEFPIYGTSMSLNVIKAVKKRELFDKSSIILSTKCLPVFNPNHLIIKDIFDCILSDKDLKKFCENG